MGQFGGDGYVRMEAVAEIRKARDGGTASGPRGLCRGPGGGRALSRMRRFTARLGRQRIQGGPRVLHAGGSGPVAWIDYEKDPRVSLGKIDASAWWTVFNDPKLDALMHQASCQNLSLRVAGARILQAKALRGIAVGNIFPQTQQATADYNRVALSQNVANPQSTPFYNQFDAGFNLSWELDFWGRFRRAVESADAALNSSIEGYDNALVLLLSEVATSYVELRVAPEQMRRTAENIQSQEQVLAVAQKRFDAKVITKLDLLQVRDNVAQSKANLQGLRNKARLASDALCVLLGLPPHDLTADPMVGDGPVPVVPTSHLVRPAELLRRRPDIRQAERLVAAQSARIGIAESELYPHFGLNGVLEWQSQNGSNLFTPTAWREALVPRLSGTSSIMAAFRTGLPWREASSKNLSTLINRPCSRRPAKAEDAISGYLTWQDQEINLREGVKALAEAQGLCHSRPRQGGGNNRLYVVLLEKTRQDNQWVDSKGQICQSLIQIYQALGGGWEIRLQGAASAAAPNTPAAAPNTPAAAPNTPAAGTNIPVAAENIPVPAADKPAGVHHRSNKRCNRTGKSSGRRPATAGSR